MRDAVEERLDVEIEHPVLFPTTSARLSQRVLGLTPRTVAIAVGAEDRLELLLRSLATAVCATWSATPGTPSVLTPAP
jgi:hypothetical protein